ncbi:hypothetical protein NicSoilC5_25180 [Arthrobacter sp. NicSoilC5]|nr:hypothetical protein NicSoilC5_25180 [Arthrobacter sp. NicSoilC5]
MGALMMFEAFFRRARWLYTGIDQYSLENDGKRKPYCPLVCRRRPRGRKCAAPRAATQREARVEAGRVAGIQEQDGDFPAPAGLGAGTGPALTQKKPCRAP